MSVRRNPSILVPAAMVLLTGAVPLGCKPVVYLSPPPAPATGEITAERFARHVTVLAEPALGGRMTGTPGNARAAEYIAKQFAAIGLQPGGEGDTWFQPFPVPPIRLPGAGCELRGPDGKPLEVHRDFAPMATGTNGAFRAPLVFAGYGLRNWVRGYDDYARLSARGAVVMVLQGEPHDERGRSRWAPRGSWTGLSSTRRKLREAARRGAVAALVVTPPAIAPQHDPLYDVLGEAAGPLPAVRISRATADRFLAEAGHDRTLAAAVRRIHATGNPGSFAVGAKVEGKVDLVEGRGRNVIGVLPPDSGEGRHVVVLGAHYDHLPASGRKARNEGFGVRPGADDNASGVAALLLTAAGLRRTTGRKGTFVFIAFDGEEIGFHGSRFYVRHPTVQRGKIAAMIALDQVGHVRNDRMLLIGSVLLGPIHRALRGAQRYNPGLKARHVPWTSTRRWSDQAPFADAGVPTLLVHAGRTGVYHRRTDTADRINDRGGARVARLTYEIARHLDADLAR